MSAQRYRRRTGEVPTTRVSAKLKADLVHLAEQTERPLGWHVNQALAHYVRDNLLQVRAITKGLEEARAGRLIPHAEVIAWIESLGTDHELPMPKWKPRASSSADKARNTTNAKKPLKRVRSSG